MSYSDLISGPGFAGYALEITGMKYVFCTDDISISGTLGTSYDGVKPWLQWSGIEIDDEGMPIEGTMSVSGIRLSIVDLGDGFTKMLSGSQYLNMTVLTSTLSSTETSTVNVDSNSGFAASGDLYIGEEIIGYTAKGGGTTFTTLTRGKYGTQAVEHEVDTSARPIPKQPAVLDGLEHLIGRRANLYICHGNPASTTCIYRGYITGDIEYKSGIWMIGMDHISKMWSRSICTNMHSSKVPSQYYISGQGGSSVLDPSTSRVIEHDYTSSPAITAQSLTVDEGSYIGPQELCDAWNDAAMTMYTASSFSIKPQIGTNGDKFSIITTNVTDVGYIINVYKYDVLWCLGFEPGEYYLPPENTDNPHYFDAQNDPRLFMIEMRNEPVIACDDTSGFFADGYVRLPGNHAVKVSSVSSTEVALYPHAFDGRFVEFRTPLVVEDEEDLELHSAMFFDNDSPQDVIEKCLNMHTGQVEPRDWLINGIKSVDIDYDELIDALTGTPIELRTLSGVITKKISFDKFICDHLGILGVCPRVTTDGKIGFTKIQYPTENKANDLEIDDSIYAEQTVASAQLSIGGQSKINEVVIEYNHDYLEGKNKETTLTYYDGKEALGKTHAKRYSCQLLNTNSTTTTRPYWASNAIELLTAFAVRGSGCHFGIYGRQSPTVWVDCTWQAKTFRVGDIVKVTHPNIPDICYGTRGMTERMGIVLARSFSFTEDAPDRLKIMFPPPENVGEIAPCALATSYDKPNKTLTFADIQVYSQSPGNDLEFFEVGMDVIFYEYNATVATVYSSAEIVSISQPTREVELDTDPFPAGWPSDGVWMIWPGYNSCSDSQKAWLFEGKTGYSLGSTNDDAYVWGA